MDTLFDVDIQNSTMPIGFSLGCVLVAISGWTLLSNLAVFTILITNRVLRKDSHCTLLLSLSVSDACVGTSSLVVVANFVFVDASRSVLACSFVFLFWTTSVSASTLQITLICIERTVRLRSFKVFKRHFTVCRNISYIVCVWMVSLVYSVVPMMMWTRSIDNGYVDSCTVDNLYTPKGIFFAFFGIYFLVVYLCSAIVMLFLIQSLKRKTKTMRAFLDNKSDEHDGMDKLLPYILTYQFSQTRNHSSDQKSTCTGVGCVEQETRFENLPPTASSNDRFSRTLTEIPGSDPLIHDENETTDLCSGGHNHKKTSSSNYGKGVPNYNERNNTCACRRKLLKRGSSCSSKEIRSDADTCCSGSAMSHSNHKESTSSESRQLKCNRSLLLCPFNSHDACARCCNFSATTRTCPGTRLFYHRQGKHTLVSSAKASVKTLYILFFLLTILIPVQMVLAVLKYFCDDVDISDGAAVVLGYLTVLNSAINPTVYVFTVKKFRHILVRYFRRTRHSSIE